MSKEDLKRGLSLTPDEPETPSNVPPKTPVNVPPNVPKTVQTRPDSSPAKNDIDLAQALQLFSAGDYKTAAPVLEKHAKLKNPKAELAFGLCCVKGLGVSYHPDKAKYYLGKAAEHGETAANQELELLREKTARFGSSAGTGVVMKSNMIKEKISRHKWVAVWTVIRLLICAAYIYYISNLYRTFYDDMVIEALGIFTYMFYTILIFGATIILGGLLFSKVKWEYFSVFPLAVVGVSVLYAVVFMICAGVFQENNQPMGTVFGIYNSVMLLVPIILNFDY